MALEPGQLIEDEKLINEILANKKKKELEIKYDIEDGAKEVPDGALKDKILKIVEEKKIKKENDDSPFEKNVKNFIIKYFPQEQQERIEVLKHNK